MTKLTTTAMEQITGGSQFDLNSASALANIISASVQGISTLISSITATVLGVQKVEHAPSGSIKTDNFTVSWDNPAPTNNGNNIIGG